MKGAAIKMFVSRTARTRRIRFRVDQVQEFLLVGIGAGVFDLGDSEIEGLPPYGLVDKTGQVVFLATCEGQTGADGAVRQRPQWVIVRSLR